MKAIYKILFFCSIHICFVSIHGMLNLPTKRLKDFRLLKPLSQQRLVQTQKPQTLTLSPVWLQDTFSGLKPIAKHYWNELSVFSYKNVWSNYFAFNPESATKLLEKTWETNPQLAENLGLFIFQRMAKDKEKYITYEMGQCLAQIVKIFVLNEKDVPEDILEFIVLNDKSGFGFGRLNNMKLELFYSAKEKELLKTKFFKRLIPILKKYKELYIKREMMMVNLIRLFEGMDDPDFLEVIFGLDNNYAQTPSYRHLQNNYGGLSMSVSDLIPGYGYMVGRLFNPNFIHMIQQIIYKEKELIDAGYEVFYHGRRWANGFLSDMYGMLYSYKSGKELNDFIFTQLDDPALGKVSEKFYAAETEKRERLIKEGNPYNSKKHSFGIINRASLLFLNKFLFGNMHNLGSSSLFYALLGINVGKIDFPIKEIFNMFGCDDAYQEFAQQLKDLRQEYNSLTGYGEMLQIAVPKKNVDECIYYTRSGGPKEEFVSEADEITTDINVILESLDKNPRDIVEFVLVETRDKFGGLNPESGIKVFSYNAVDPKKMAAFKEKEKELFERIKEWMWQKKRRVELEQRARE
ncbi:MAG TPA: hypothetical protein VKU36_01115 [Candidatus Babeliales bacterium]|nr:hypothetical protein [Candidatus Babeliales bacterium]